MEANYKRALKNGYRYESVRGLLTTEDLFDLPLTGNNGFNLDQVAIAIDEKMEKLGSKSFVNSNAKSAQRKVEEAKLEIVKDIIADKIEEQEKVKRAAEKAAKKQKILELLAKKQDESLEAKSEEELLAELEALDDE